MLSEILRSATLDRLPPPEGWFCIKDCGFVIEPEKANMLLRNINENLPTKKLQSFAAIVLGGGSLSRASRFAVAKKIGQNKVNINQYSG